MRSRIKAFIGSLVTTCLATTTFNVSQAAAADLGGAPVRPPRDFAHPYEPRLNLERWTGFYLGGTLGYGVGEGRASGAIGSFAFDQSGAVGMVFAGYNWQLGRNVIGLEADLGTGNLSARTTTASGAIEHDLNAMGSFRGRAGFLLTPALLLYGNAGLAWANMDIGFAGNGKVSETFWGYQLGAGAELAITSNVGLRLEYIFTDLDRQRVNHSGQSNFYDPDSHTVRAGISLKF